MSQHHKTTDASKQVALEPRALVGWSNARATTGSGNLGLSDCAAQVNFGAPGYWEPVSSCTSNVRAGVPTLKVLFKIPDFMARPAYVLISAAGYCPCWPSHVPAGKISIKGAFQSEVSVTIVFPTCAAQKTSHAQCRALIMLCQNFPAVAT